MCGDIFKALVIYYYVLLKQVREKFGDEVMFTVLLSLLKRK